MRFFQKCSYKTAAVVITTNESQKRFAVERGHCRPERVFVVRNVRGSRRPLRWIPRKGSARFLLGYVGIMGAQDGVEYTLYALDELVHKRGRQDISMVLLGDGSNFPVLRALSQRPQGWTRTSSSPDLRPCAEVARYISVADIGLIPDPQNGLNEYSTMLKAMDYMAFGKPIVAFDLTETRFTAQAAALYARPNLVGDFADKIEMLLADKDLPFKMGQLGGQRIEEEL